MTGRTAEAVVSPRIAALSPVLLGPPPRDLGPTRPVRRLHLNEGPFPPAPAVITAMRAAAADLHRYPDNDGTDLVAALAARTGVAAERIVLGAGSNELLYGAADVAIEPGDVGLSPAPGFGSYARAVAMRGGRSVGVPVRDDGAVDVVATLAAVTPATRLVFVATPNNPTGGLISAADLDRLVAGLPNHLLLVVDEAYHEFARAAGGPDVIAALARRRGPWIVTRTFSKAYGLAGARIGWGIASSAEIADAFRKVRTTFSVSTVALAGARAALDETAHMERLVASTTAERERLAGALAPHGFRAMPSAANFVMLTTPSPADRLAAALRDENIFVVPMPWRETAGALRVTIGTPEDDDALIAALTAIATDR
ncbi:pyridoxal phosphate-dependent aminotransferase [Rhodoplanes roseus]|nr:aminotransferase class I/II-fold pyridoxal phosphate-dependent enzyme [Rhodoplanes roseus]